MNSFDFCPKCPDCGSCYSLTCQGCLRGDTSCICGWISPAQQVFIDKYFEELAEYNQQVAEEPADLNRQVAEDLAIDQRAVHGDDCDCLDCNEEESWKDEDCQDIEHEDEGDSALQCLVCEDDMFNGVCEKCNPLLFKKREEENTPEG